jgi:hypothetical protein
MVDCFRPATQVRSMRLALFLAGFTVLWAAGDDWSPPSNLAAECAAHADCGATQFCRRFYHLRESDGVTLPFSRCTPCSECTCHTYANDGFCPIKCGTPAQETTQLKGVLYGTSEHTRECMEVWTFDDLAFTSLIQITNFSNTSFFNQRRTVACPKAAEFGGRRYGTFKLDTSSYPAKLVITYDDRGNKPGGPVQTRTASVFSNCPGGVEIRWDGASPKGVWKCGKMTACLFPTGISQRLADGATCCAW